MKKVTFEIEQIDGNNISVFCKAEIGEVTTIEFLAIIHSIHIELARMSAVLLKKVGNATIGIHPNGVQN